MAVIDSLTLDDIAKLVGITFMALMGFISFLFTILSILIYRNNNSEIEAAKVEVNTATSNLQRRSRELDTHIDQRIADAKQEFHETQYHQRRTFERDITTQMNMSLLELELENNAPSDDRVYMILSRLMNTATLECEPIIHALLEHHNVSADVKRHGELLLSEITSQ